MIVMIFDGKAFAREIEEDLICKVRNFVQKPKVVSILVGNDPASELYTRLKSEAAKRVGVQFDVIKLDARCKMLDVRREIEKQGARADVTGVMVQLPMLGLQGQALQDVLSAIPLQKDVDGLRWEESGIMPATVRAILSILDRIEIITNHKFSNSQIVVIGARGSVGRPLCHYLRQKGAEVIEVE